MPFFSATSKQRTTNNDNSNDTQSSGSNADDNAATTIHNTPLSHSNREMGIIGALALPNQEHEHLSDRKQNPGSSPPTQTIADEKNYINNVDPESTQTKGDYVKTEAVGADEEEEENDPELKDIPWQVRRMVSFTDDPTLPTITFRYFLLTVFFIVPGAFLSQLSQVCV